MPKPENVIPHKIKKGEVKNPNGRPRKLVGSINKELAERGISPVTLTQVQDMFMQLSQLTFDEVKELANADDVPIMVRIYAKNLLDPKKHAELIERMIDRAHGKAKQQIEQKSIINFASEPIDAETAEKLIDVIKPKD